MDRKELANAVKFIASHTLLMLLAASGKPPRGEQLRAIGFVYGFSLGALWAVGE